jgi:hypothetical protein
MEPAYTIMNSQKTKNISAELPMPHVTRCRAIVVESLYKARKDSLDRIKKV